MLIEINTTDSTPVYLQLVNCIKEAVYSGDLKEGTMLPRIRQLANDLEINHNTVAKAYQILEHSKIVYTAGRKGTFIAKIHREKIDNELESEAEEQIINYLNHFLAQGMKLEKIEEIVQHQIQEKKNA